MAPHGDASINSAAHRRGESKARHTAVRSAFGAARLASLSQRLASLLARTCGRIRPGACGAGRPTPPAPRAARDRFRRKDP